MMLKKPYNVAGCGSEYKFASANKIKMPSEKDNQVMCLLRLQPNQVFEL